MRRPRYFHFYVSISTWLTKLQKLQPFFPPLEPLQSLNLRAALFRSLNELKKNGVLGRESVLRKTMLDECKGDKFYEILALFSNVVLKKRIAAKTRNDENVVVARQLAMAATLSSKQQQSLLPLAIAHKAALVNVLKRKEEKRARFLEFENLLDTKAEDISRRIRKCKDTPRAKKPAVPQREADAVKKQLRDNWIGNQKWLDVMLHGDNVQAEDAFLSSRFEKVWYMVEKGQKLEDATTETGLMENLQTRVREQDARLRKWKTFHQEIQEKNFKSDENLTKAPVATKELRFDAHMQHQLPKSKKRSDEKTVRQAIVPAEYEEILSDMNTELLPMSSSVEQHPPSPLSTRRRSSSTRSRSPIRSRIDIHAEPLPIIAASPAKTTRQPPLPRELSTTNAPAWAPSRHPTEAATPADSEATLIGHTSMMRSIATTRNNVDSEVDNPNVDLKPSEPTPPNSDSLNNDISPSHVSHEPHQTEQLSPSPQPSPVDSSPMYPSEPPLAMLESPELKPEEVLAEQIITSIGDATPSPVKKPQPRMSISLIERTRMSMARTTSFEPLPESPELPLPPMPPPPPVEADTNRRATLLERTRLSMVAMQSKPRQSLAARERKEKRKSRASLFPVNQFDTPRNRKSFELIEETKSIEHTPTEVLFSDAVDYDRVFKSRPRIATSPVFSPPPDLDGEGSEEEYEDGVTGIDLGDVDQDYEDDDGFTKTWADSPSRRAGAVGRC